MDKEDFENMFAYTLDEETNWNIKLKDGKIIDDCSIELNTLLNNVGEDYQLVINSNGEKFLESHPKTHLEDDLYRFMKLNPDYNVGVKMILNFKKIE